MPRGCAFGTSCRSAKRSATAAFPGKVFAVSKIPIGVPEHFLGREGSPTAIETALSRYEGGSPSPRCTGCAASARRRSPPPMPSGIAPTTAPPGGSGRNTPDVALRADLVGLGVRFGWVAADEKEEPALATVMDRLRHEGEGILLIYDNAVDCRRVSTDLPRGGARAGSHHLERPHRRGVASPVEIRLWPKDIGADYLIA